MAVEDHTEGRQIMQRYTKAYLAGLIDGDGSIMLQLKPRKGSKFGVRVKTLLVIYQDSKMKVEMDHLQSELGAGYTYERNDHIMEIRIEGHQQVERVLGLLKPFIRFKYKQVELILSAIKSMRGGVNTKEEILHIASIADQISACNYKSSQKKYTLKYIRDSLSP